MLIPRSSYRKAIGEGVRTITYGAHTSLAAYKKSHKFITNITTAERHEAALLLCHKLATLMPRSVPYLAITVVALSTGEELAPHRDILETLPFPLESGQVACSECMKMTFGRIRIHVMNG